MKTADELWQDVEEANQRANKVAAPFLRVRQEAAPVLDQAERDYAAAWRRAYRHARGHDTQLGGIL